MFRHNNAKIRRSVSRISKISSVTASGSNQPHRQDGQSDLDNSGLDKLSRYLEIALNNMGRGISMIDADQNLILCNNTYRDLYALPEALTKPGTPFLDILTYHVSAERRSDTGFDTTQLQTWIDGLVARLRQDQSIENSQRLNSGRTVRVSYQPLSDGGWVDIQEDITEQCEAERKINWLAQHDPMTGVANRFHFREALDSALAELESSQSGIALHWFDLDHFKNVNDTYGHLAGDTLLKSFTERLKQVVRVNDVIGRLGGDEFAILQRDVRTQCQAKAFIQRLNDALAAPHQLGDRELVMSTSIGTSLAPYNAGTAETLLQKADLALYAAKFDGRARHKFYTPEIEQASMKLRTIEDELREAIRLEQFELHYQPIVDVKQGQINSIETLIRWRHPERGLVSPDSFISIAEKNALIVPIGAWVLRRACLDALSWPNSMKVTVNVSPVQFQCSDLAATVRAVLEETGLPAHRLELEITESVLLDNDAATTAALHAIRDLGIGIALDDFGTAFSSLSYLTRFPFNRIKVDRSFVKDLPERNDCLAIVNAVSGLARALNIVTTAEGVETAEQLTILQAAGCQEIQGYLFSRPVPAGMLLEALTDCRMKMMVMASGEGNTLPA